MGCRGVKDKRILIVEDERIVALDIHQKVTKFGYNNAIVASSGAEALEKASMLRPDLVIMDVALDGPLDGIETAARMREQESKAIPIIFLTAHGDDTTTSLAMNILPDRLIRFILKPFEEETLRRAMESAFSEGLEPGNP
jgi:CheY-like chemotaxis protein